MPAADFQRVEDVLAVLRNHHARGLDQIDAGVGGVQRAGNRIETDFAFDLRFQLTAEGLASWVADPQARSRYVEAFRRSDFQAMLNYYRRNYPREPYREDTSPLVKVQCPVLLIHGLKDRYLLAAALNDNWSFVQRDLTLVTIPDADHFVQQDAAELVSRTIKSWLSR